MGGILHELAALLVYGWGSKKVQQFRQDREDNTSKVRPKIAKRQPRGIDHSFHNNIVIVRRWITQLKDHEQSSNNLELILDLVMGMLEPQPRSRVFMWEAALDLHNILNPDFNRVNLHQDKALQVRSPYESHGSVQIPNGTHTPLHRAAIRQSTSRVKNLHAKGWPISAQDNEDFTVLYIINQSPNRSFRESLESYFLFYTLGNEPEWIRADDHEQADHRYWRHLTYESYMRYSIIYELAKNRKGTVDCKSHFPL